MPTPVTCAHCGKTVNLPDNWAQPGFKCPHCKQATSLPLPAPPPVGRGELVTDDQARRRREPEHQVVEHHSYDHTPMRSAFGAAFGVSTGCLLGVLAVMGGLLVLGFALCAGCIGLMGESVRRTEERQKEMERQKEVEGGLGRAVAPYEKSNAIPAPAGVAPVKAEPDLPLQPKPAFIAPHVPEPPAAAPTVEVAPPPREVALTGLKGTIVLVASSPLSAGVRAWVEVDGERVADWKAGLRQIELRAFPGDRHVVVRGELKGTVRVVFDEVVRVAPGGRTAVLVDRKK